MVRRSLVLFLLAGLTAPALAQERAAQPEGRATGRAPAGQAGPPPLPPHLKNVPTPKSPGPGIALASVNEGQVYVRFVLPFAKPNADGQVEKGQGGELASFAQPFDGASVQASTADGKKVSTAELARRLAKETPVVLSSAQFPPDPTYLQVIKGDTLVLLLPAQPGGAAGSGGNAPPAGNSPRTPR